MVISGVLAHGCNNYEIFAFKSKSLQALGSQCHANRSWSSAFQVATDAGASGLGNNPRQSWELSREHMAGKITAVLSTFCERFTHLGKVFLILIHGTRQKRRNGSSSHFCRLVKRLRCRA